MSAGALKRGPLVERFGNLELPLRGKNEYAGVRGKQGRSSDRFQGYTPKKKHFTRLCDTAQEAAVALATLKMELEAGFDGMTQEVKPRKKRSRRCIELPQHVSSELGPAASMVAAWPPSQRIIVPASSLRELTPEEGRRAAACGTAVVRAVRAPCPPPRVALPAPPAMVRAHMG